LAAQARAAFVSGLTLAMLIAAGSVIAAAEFFASRAPRGAAAPPEAEPASPCPRRRPVAGAPRT